MKIKKLRIILLTLLFGTVGVYFLVSSFALSCRDENGDGIRCPANLVVTNPPLSAGCGYDIALLGDTSSSMMSYPAGPKMFDTMRVFVDTMKNTNTQFAIGNIFEDEDNITSAFTSDTATLHQNITNMGRGGGHIRDLRTINQLDKRPNNQNLIILLTDMVNNWETSAAHLVKQSGTRILILQFRAQYPDSQINSAEITADRIYLAGPNTKQNSVLTDYVINWFPTTFSDIATALAAHAKQPCSPPPPSPGPGPNPGTNPGPGDGNGTGTGNGSGSGGSGTGTNGSGQGQSPGTGTGGGGGGSTSNKPDDKPNPLPSPTGQGDKNKQPDVEPSPFFDGKLFAIGSDVDSEDIRGVSIAGRTFGLGWVYLAILLAIVTGLLALYFLWWRRLSTKDKQRWKKRVRLGK